MKRNNPDTSISAYKSLREEELRAIYSVILGSLKVLKEATTEQISDMTGVEHSRIWKRVSELERLGLIYRPGGKTLTKSGRNAYLWARTDDISEKAKPIEKSPKGKSIASYTKDILNLAKQSVQQTLF